MGVIYVLQKDIAGLGILTKIGMTTRSGNDRAQEYGGGGWVCVKEFAVDADKSSSLRDYERRIHERLEPVKCREAESFGLTEVFNCKAEIAIAVVSDVVGREPTLDEEVARLRRNVSKGVASRLRKQYEAKYARVVKEGRYPGKLRTSEQVFCGLEGGLLQLAKEFLRALENLNEDDPVFRALLESEVRTFQPKCDAIMSSISDPTGKKRKLNYSTTAVRKKKG